MLGRPVLADQVAAAVQPSPTDASPLHVHESSAVDAGPDVAEVLPAAPPEGPAAGLPTGSLPQAVRERLAAVAIDPEPAYLDAMSAEGMGRHFYCSDEWNLQAYRPHLEGRGGAYVGIGSEQGYMLIGWARPELAWLVDYDAEIVALHDALDAMILASDGPEDFVAPFLRPDVRQAVAKIEASELPEARRAPALAAFRRGFGRLRRRFMYLRERGPKLGFSSWLDDSAQFSFVQTMLREGRIRHGRIDLTASVGMRAIGEVLGELGVPLRVLYLSNAEQYWTYSQAFRDNVASLPFDEDSLVLRSLSTHKTNGDYRYNIHAALDFRERLGDPAIRQVYQLVEPRKLNGYYDVELSFSPNEVAIARRLEREGPAFGSAAQPAITAPRPAAGSVATAADEEDAIVIDDEDVARDVAVAQATPASEVRVGAQVRAAEAAASRARPDGASSDPAPADPIPAALAVAPPSGSRAAQGCATAPAGMVCIPAGDFLRGVDEGSSYAKPQMSIWLQTFYIDAREVTYAQYRACADAGKCPDAQPLYPGFREADMPMHGVSWYDADAYCRAMGKALPSETQWEKAARGTDGRTYPWGDEPADCERAVILVPSHGRGCGRKGLGRHADVGRPWAVGSLAPNDYGVYDMAGNAYEWVDDWFSIDYRRCGDACAGDDPRGPCGGGAAACPQHPKKVVRGGSWYWPAYHATTFHRRAHMPENEPFHHFGFRCAASVEQATALAPG